MALKRFLKDAGKGGLDLLHRAALRAGMIVLPNHYYVPIADRRELLKTREHWAKRAPLHGIDTDPARQLAALEAKVAPFEPEFRGNRRYIDGMAGGYGPGYGYIEAQCLHGVLRALKPRRVIEVGSGVSTYVMLGAAEANAAEGHPCEITCVEPYPSPFLKSAKGVTLVESFVQHLDPAVFDTLEAGDFLFIDSTHAVKPGGDVDYLYLFVIPRLKPGVTIHIHDIYLPYLYQRNVLGTIFQWSETLLLAALLTGNQHLSIDFSLSQLHYDEPEGLRRVFPEYEHQKGEDGLAEDRRQGHFPSSIYLTTR